MKTSTNIHIMLQNLRRALTQIYHTDTDIDTHAAIPRRLWGTAPGRPADPSLRVLKSFTENGITFSVNLRTPSCTL